MDEPVEQPHPSQHDFVAGGPWGTCNFSGRGILRCGLSEDSPFHAGPYGHTMDAVMAYEQRKALRIAAFVRGDTDVI